MVTTNELMDLAEATDFSGVVRRSNAGAVVGEFARGHADRRHQIANTTTTCFAAASATKGFTALAIMSLIESGALSLATPLRSIVGDDLPLVDPGVTIEQLLGHRSGVGDYLDEEEMGDIDDFILGQSAHTFEQPSDYVPLLAAPPQVSAPGTRFAYNNGGYMMLALVIERLAGSYSDAVATHVLTPAGIANGGFFRSDDLPARAALGYLESGRSNVFHLPVIGGGDGGIYLSLDDMSAFWGALFSGAIVSDDFVARMTTPTHLKPNGDGYGLGFWLRDSGQTVQLEGMDAGVSFKSSYDQKTHEAYTVMSNTSSGAWPFVRLIEGRS